MNKNVQPDSVQRLVERLRSYIAMLALHQKERLQAAIVLPAVAGRRLRGSNDDFERACLVHIERLQDGLGDYDSAMLDTFCEAVRLVREYNDAVAMPNDAVAMPNDQALTNQLNQPI